MDGYAALGIFFLMALGFPIAPIIIANIIQPKQPTDEKDIPYECGVDTIGKNNVQYHIGYFMYALVFLLIQLKLFYIALWVVKSGA